MPTGHDDILERLEVAVSAWNLEIAQMRGALAAEIRKLALQLELLPGSAAASEPNAQLQARAAELETLLQSARMRLEQLEEQEREEAARMAEIASAPSGELGPRLAEALRDRDEAHQEIVALRAEADLLRRANARLSGPLSSFAGGPATPVEIFDSEGRRRRLGEILLDLGAIGEAQLNAALAEQSQTPQRRLGAILVENGITGEDLVARILARQLGIPFLQLGENVADEAAARAISASLARRCQCLPVSISPGRLMLAMANPFDLTAIEDVELASGRRVDPAVATAGDVKAALIRHYGPEESGPLP